MDRVGKIDVGAPPVLLEEPENTSIRFVYPRAVGIRPGISGDLGTTVALEPSSRDIKAILLPIDL